MDEKRRDKKKIEAKGEDRMKRTIGGQRGTKETMGRSKETKEIMGRSKEAIETMGGSKGTKDGRIKRSCRNNRRTKRNGVVLLKFNTRTLLTFFFFLFCRNEHFGSAPGGNLK